MLSSRKTATQTRPSSSPKRHVPPLENRTISSCVRIVERAAGDLATLNSAPGSLSMESVRIIIRGGEMAARIVWPKLFKQRAAAISAECAATWERVHLSPAADPTSDGSEEFYTRAAGCLWWRMGTTKEQPRTIKTWCNVYTVSLEQVIPNIFHPYLSFYLVKVKLCTQAFRRIFIFRAIFFAEIFIFHRY